MVTMLAALSLLFLPFVQAQSSTFVVVSQTASNVATTRQAKYSCDFINQWTSQRHPPLYPTDDARWSPPLMVAHNRSILLWANDTLASAGIEDVAERGVVSGLVAELGRLRPGVGVHSVGAVLINKNSTRQKLPDVTMPVGLTYLSSVTRMAPSPDWFSGFSRFNAANTTTKTWYRTFTLNTFAFDAGTERGDRYNSFNTEESRRISRFTENNIRSTNVYVSPASNGRQRVSPVARWECKLV